MELKVESELVLKAAKESPRDDVRKALKTIFPGVFETDKKYFNLNILNGVNGLLFAEAKVHAAGFDTKHFMAVRCDGNMAGMAFVLDTAYNWEFREWASGYYHLLIPTRKD
ncbi:hypothetical protein LCGC14_1109550 [marine sediment metagenome]|uniref:Uncharacterized protein n=2 Tax=marine sediment metagenome TaxID=412755 RepID=A0A0F9QD95_9ZZZZ|nr:hypothetical protein [Pricia sp.]